MLLSTLMTAERAEVSSCRWEFEYCRSALGAAAHGRARVRALVSRGSSRRWRASCRHKGRARDCMVREDAQGMRHLLLNVVSRRKLFSYEQRSGRRIKVAEGPGTCMLVAGCGASRSMKTPATHNRGGGGVMKASTRGPRTSIQFLLFLLGLSIKIPHFDSLRLLKMVKMCLQHAAPSAPTSSFTSMPFVI